MRLQLRRALGLATAALLATGSALASVPAQAFDVPDGELTITLLDHAGKPVPALFQVIDSEGVYQGGSSTPADTYTGELPPGRYGLMALAPQAGLFCAGISACDLYISDGRDVPGVIDIEPGEHADYTFRAPRPAVLKGAGRLGSILTVELSEPMERMTNGVGLGLEMGFGLLGGMSTEWLRNGSKIRGASADAYEIRKTDVGSTIAPRLHFPALLRAVFGELGLDLSPLTVPGVTVAKVTPRVRTSVFRKNRVAGKRTGTRIDVTARDQIVTGKVRIKVGKWTKTKSLANGSTRVRLPKLKAGKHTVKVTYLGTKVYAKAKAKNVTYKVTRKKNRKK